MTCRVTTRASRKILHVALGHVVDVATGTVILNAAREDARGSRLWQIQYQDGRGSLASRLRRVARAEAVCILVRYLVLSWQDTRCGRGVSSCGGRGLRVVGATCPYAAEINDETIDCECCESCQRECADDI